MLIYTVEQACDYRNLTKDLESYILNCNESSTINLLLASACKNDAVDIYRFICENYGMSKYSDTVFDYGSMKDQHDANLNNLVDSPKIRDYLEKERSTYLYLISRREDVKRYLASDQARNSSNKHVRYALKLTDREPCYSSCESDDLLIYKIAKRLYPHSIDRV